MDPVSQPRLVKFWNLHISKFHLIILQTDPWSKFLDLDCARMCFWQRKMLRSKIQFFTSLFDVTDFCPNFSCQLGQLVMYKRHRYLWVFIKNHNANRVQGHAALFTKSRSQRCVGCNPSISMCGPQKMGMNLICGACAAAKKYIYIMIYAQIVTWDRTRGPPKVQL